jgi:hypothetical protein
VTTPVATTTITIKRAPDRSNIDPEDYDPSDFAEVAVGIRAIIDASRAYSGTAPGPGDREQVTFSLLCDPTDLRYLDVVIDERTSQEYAVSWAVHTPGVAGYLASVLAGLTTTKGT